MGDLDFVQISALPVSGIIFYFAYKLIWPKLIASTDGAVTDNRVTNGLIAQLVAERDRAVARADAAEARADETFRELADVNAQLKVMQYQLDSLQRSNLYLKKRLNELIGGDSDEEHDGQV